MAQSTTVYREFNRLIKQRNAYLVAHNNELAQEYEAMLHELTHTHMPRGEHFESGTRIDLNKSDPDKLVFHTDYRQEDGALTPHTIVTNPFNWRFRVTGKSTAKEEIRQAFYAALSKALPQS